jgi:DNA repair protein RadD
MLHDFQQNIKREVFEAWQDSNCLNVMPVSPTGSGKTVLFCDIIRTFNAPTCAIAHRQELVSQAALSLNREGVPHGIIAPKGTIRQIIALEMETHGHSHYNSRAPVRVAGVDTLRNHDPKDRWLSAVQLVVQDEGHHVLKANKWGAAMRLFPAARGLFPTAHAVRADGAGLGRHADGLVDSLVVGPSCRELINRGFLTDYRLICPPSDVDISAVPVGAAGDFSLPQLRAAVHRSGTIVGDVVRHYLKFAAGKLGVTFTVDVESATDVANAYNAAGVPAAVITAKTPVDVRAKLMSRFRARQLLQLVSVDVLGEGVDVPAIEVVSMARHTASFQLYAQQFGRALRCMIASEVWAHWGAYTDAQRLAFIAASTKPKAIIIDHVQNYARHGLPDKPRGYNLGRRERSRRANDSIPLRVCVNPECLQAYERVLVQCPYCGLKPEPAGRSSPEQVDGDLVELDPEVLRQMRGEIDRIDSAPAVPRGLQGTPAAFAIQRNHYDRQAAQLRLRDAIALWAGWQFHRGRSQSEGYRGFFHSFGVDVMSAQALNTKDAAELEARVRAVLMVGNVVAA